MNGQPLPIDHGYPARLIIPGLYGYVSATKWLSEIELTTLEAFDAYWVPLGWAKEAPILTQSRIDTPAGRRQPRGRLPAFRSPASPGLPIAASSRVEVQIDEGAWQAGGAVRAAERGGLGAVEAGLGHAAGRRSPPHQGARHRRRRRRPDRRGHAPAGPTVPAAITRSTSRWARRATKRAPLPHVDGTLDERVGGAGDPHHAVPVGADARPAGAPQARPLAGHVGRLRPGRCR